MDRKTLKDQLRTIKVGDVDEAADRISRDGLLAEGSGHRLGAVISLFDQDFEVALIPSEVIRRFRQDRQGWNEADLRTLRAGMDIAILVLMELADPPETLWSNRDDLHRPQP